MIDMADDRRPFRDLAGIDGESTDSRHPGEIEINMAFGDGAGPAGRWDQEMEHGVVADPGGAPALPAEYGPAGSDQLEFGAGAGPVVAEPPPPVSQEVVTGSDDILAPDRLLPAGDRMAAAAPEFGEEPGEGLGGLGLLDAASTAPDPAAPVDDGTDPVADGAA